MHDPREPHLEAALRILRYLKSQPGKGILLSPTSGTELGTLLLVGVVYLEMGGPLQATVSIWGVT